MLFFTIITIVCLFNLLLGLLVFKYQLNNTTTEHAARILDWFDESVTNNKVIDFSIKLILIFVWPVLIYLFIKSKNC